MEEIIQTENLNLWYGKFHALKDVNLTINKKEVTALIGPFGCGKSTFLRALNRLNDEVSTVRMEGKVYLYKQDILAKDVDLVELRKNVGMVFQQPNPFNGMTILQNITIGPQLNNLMPRLYLHDWAVECLKMSNLWNEVKDKLNAPASSLSGGQQQRLCIARALSTKPKVLLMDEPTSALDPIATVKIEELIEELKENVTIVMVTHSMAQARRISDKVSFFMNGVLVESASTQHFFENPQNEESKNYVSGKIG